ncbi:hypothetical protein V1511DRAFT_485956 [Dipodascopsis uninucleata]
MAPLKLFRSKLISPKKEKGKDAKAHSENQATASRVQVQDGASDAVVEKVGINDVITTVYEANESINGSGKKVYAKESVLPGRGLIGLMQRKKSFDKLRERSLKEDDNSYPKNRPSADSSTTEPFAELHSSFVHADIAKEDASTMQSNNVLMDGEKFPIIASNNRPEDIASRFSNVNAREGAQRAIAMATYRTASFAEYERRASIVEFTGQSGHSNDDCTTESPVLSLTSASSADDSGQSPVSPEDDKNIIADQALYGDCNREAKEIEVGNQEDDRKILLSIDDSARGHEDEQGTNVENNAIAESVIEVNSEIEEVDNGERVGEQNDNLENQYEQEKVQINEINDADCIEEAENSSGPVELTDTADVDAPVADETDKAEQEVTNFSEKHENAESITPKSMDTPSNRSISPITPLPEPTIPMSPLQKKASIDRIDHVRSSNNTNTADVRLVHYPAPIPARIRLPPLLSDKKKRENKQKKAQEAAYFPMSVPLDEDKKKQPKARKDVLPTQPGSMVMSEMPNPNGALESILDKSVESRGGLMAEEPIIEGPSLVKELEERLQQQKLRRKQGLELNTYRQQSSGTLLRLDDEIKYSQERRRTAVSTYGLSAIAKESSNALSSNPSSTSNTGPLLNPESQSMGMQHLASQVPHSRLSTPSPEFNRHGKSLSVSNLTIASTSTSNLASLHLRNQSQGQLAQQQQSQQLRPRVIHSKSNSDSSISSQKQLSLYGPNLPGAIAPVCDINSGPRDARQLRDQKSRSRLIEEPPLAPASPVPQNIPRTATGYFRDEHCPVSQYGNSPHNYGNGYHIHHGHSDSRRSSVLNSEEAAYRRMLRARESNPRTPGYDPAMYPPVTSPTPQPQHHQYHLQHQMAAYPVSVASYAPEPVAVMPTQVYIPPNVAPAPNSMSAGQPYAAQMAPAQMFIPVGAPAQQNYLRSTTPSPQQYVAAPVSYTPRHSMQLHYTAAPSPAPSPSPSKNASRLSHVGAGAGVGYRPPSTAPTQHASRYSTATPGLEEANYKRMEVVDKWRRSIYGA